MLHPSRNTGQGVYRCGELKRIILESIGKPIHAQLFYHSLVNLFGATRVRALGKGRSQVCGVKAPTVTVVRPEAG